MVMYTEYGAQYEPSGIALDIRREDDPVAYKKAYRQAYVKLNRDRLSAAAAQKYAEANKDLIAAREAKRKQRKDEAQRERLSNKAYRLALRGMRAPEREARHREVKRAYRKQRRAEGKIPYPEKRAKRVAWASEVAMLAVHCEARRLTAVTGVLHHVDHIYPLQGVSVCGLHTEHNLRAVPAWVNAEKSNSLPGVLADELWDPDSSEVYFDGDLYTQTQKKAIEAEEQSRLAKIKKAEEQEARRQLARERAKAARALETQLRVPGKRGRKPMSAEQAAARPDVRMLLTGASVRETIRQFGGANAVNLVKWARLVDPEYKSPYHHHGRPQRGPVNCQT